MTKPQVIVSQSGERMIVLPEADYLAMVEQLDTVDDLAAVRAFDRKLATGEEELVPSTVVDRVLDGENKVRVWREYRGETVGSLADMAGLSSAYVSQIEAGARRGSVATLRKLAVALKVDVDDLV